MSASSLFNRQLIPAVFLCAISTGFATLTVEVVDDSGQANSPYLLIVGKSVTQLVPPTSPAPQQQATALPMFLDPGTGMIAQAAADASFTLATATATQSGGVITALNLINGGSGYQSVSGAPIPVQFIGGTSGTTTAATALASFGPMNISVVNGGTGYTAAPTVTLTGGGGAGATATAVLAANAVTSITVNSQGTGYTSVPTVTISGGGGSGATAAAAFGTSAIQGFTVTSGGVSYTSTPTATITGGGGTGATATVTFDSNQQIVTSVNLTSAGTGYTSTPTVTITGGGGYAATAIAVFGRSVASLNIISGGSGYAGTPGVSIPNTITPITVDQLQDSGTTVVSSYTGLTRTVRTFTVDTLGSGAFMIFANNGSGSSPFLYQNNANPTPNSNFRFDQCEVTFNAAIQSGANLTSINALSMPMRFDLFDSSMNKLGERKYYASLTSILNQFPASLSNALFQQGVTAATPGWTPADGMSTFLRALGPGEAAAVSGTNTTGSPAPYPSFSTYLGTLAAMAPTTPATATASIQGGTITQVNVATVGSGYTSAPSVSFSGGPGTGATATAVLNAQNVVGVNVTNGGSGYTSPVTVSFTGGGGSGATANAVLATGVSGVTVGSSGSGYKSDPAVTLTGGGGLGATAMVSHSVSSISVTAGGAGYTSAPIVTFTGGGGGTGAAATATVTNGAVTGLNVTAPGSGYTSVPSVVLAGGNGTGASADAVLNTGTIAGVTVTQPGTGYTSAPTVTFSTFNVSGSSNGSDYNYSGNVQTASNGYQVILNGTTYAANTSNPYAGGAPVNAQVTVNLPATVVQATAKPTVNASGQVATIAVSNGGHGYMSPPIVTVAGPSSSGTTAAATATLTGDVVTGISVTNAGSGYSSTSLPVVTVSPPAGSMDTFIYGATLSADSFSVAGLTPAQVAANTNIVYGAVTRDALAAINFGFIGGNWGNTGTEWFGFPPSSFPFGAARPIDDGYYNSYAALLYNTSDAYGFAFSDRINPSPLITMQDGQTLRITILPDAWGVEAPQPTVSNITNTSFQVQWPAVTGATGYVVTVIDPPGIAPQPSSPNLSQTVTVPSAGTPYTVTVTAQGTASGNPVSAESQPIQVITTGSPAASTGSNTFIMTLAYTPPSFLLGGTIAGEIDGQPLTYNAALQQWSISGGAPGPTLNANAGSNSYPFIITDGDGVVLYASNAAIDYDSGTSTYSGTFYNDGTTTTAGSGSSTVLSLNIASAIGSKEFNPVNFNGAPSPTPTPTPTPPAFVKSTFNGIVGSGDLGSGAAEDMTSFYQGNGYILINTMANGSFSGTLRLQGRILQFRGKFDAAGMATVTINRKGKSPLTLNLSYNNATQNQVAAAISASDFLVPLTSVALRSAYTGGPTNTHPLAGNRYTVLLPSPASNYGAGYATMLVMYNGTTRLAGKLADGISFSTAARLVDDGNGNWKLPVDVRIYPGLTGLLNGELLVPQVEPVGAADVTGSLGWLRPANFASNFFPQGFVNPLSPMGARYKLRKDISFLSGTAATANFLLTFDPSLSILPATVTQVGIWPNTNKPKLTPPMGSVANFVFSKSTGSFAGRFNRTDANPVGTAYNGVVLSKPLTMPGASVPVNGGGHFSTGSQSGLMEVTVP